jgi:pyruvate dehydrogenase E2 component (dihydrolipoamide acetyltransferase)
MSEFVMPSLGADMTAGTLVGWLKKPGDRVKRGDIIAEVDTDKGVIEVEVFQDGVIESLLIKEGEKVPVGTALAMINESGEPAATTPARDEKPAQEPTAPAATRMHASPVARKLAEQLGVDLRTVQGTGPQGRIQREDVELAAKQSTQEKRPIDVAATKDDADRSARMRKAIAAAMARSKREIPHYYLATTIDMTRALEWLEIENSKRAIKDRILHGILLIKAVALALRETPEFNATWENDRLNIIDSINVGTAISLRNGGLIAPAIKDADKKGLDELMGNLRDLVQRTRSGELRSSELSTSTITITSLGEQGVETVFGVIYPPQVALVGFGDIHEGVSVQAGSIRPSRLIHATLAADHRASDGHRGSIFLASIGKLLQEPENL